MRRFALLLTCLSLLAGSAMGYGLSTSFVDVTFDNLEIDKTYSFHETSGRNIVITNTSKSNVIVKLDVILPKKDETKSGYEPLPDASWIKIVPDSCPVEPGQGTQSDLLISIPKDRHLRGKKYQFYVWSHTIGTTLGVGLRSKVYIHIKPKEPSGSFFKGLFRKVFGK